MVKVPGPAQTGGRISAVASRPGARGIALGWAVIAAAKGIAGVSEAIAAAQVVGVGWVIAQARGIAGVQVIGVGLAIAQAQGIAGVRKAIAVARETARGSGATVAALVPAQRSDPRPSPPGSPMPSAAWGAAPRPASTATVVLPAARRPHARRGEVTSAARERAAGVTPVAHERAAGVTPAEAREEAEAREGAEVAGSAW
jgi:hypothetical protein